MKLLIVNMIHYPMSRKQTSMRYLVDAPRVFHQKSIIRSLKLNDPDILCRRSVGKTYPKQTLLSLHLYTPLIFLKMLRKPSKMKDGDNPWKLNTWHCRKMIHGKNVIYERERKRWNADGCSP